MRIEVVPYDESWPEAFAAVRRELVAALARVPVRAVEHVGSTSVPGLAAKPVLDVDVVVDEARVADAIAALEAVGYRYEGDRGIPDRHAFAAPAGGTERHVYVCVDGSLALRNHLAVRGVLRADPVLRDEYAAVKLALAARDVASIDEYVEGKSAVLRRVLAAAGIAQDELDAVELVNRATAQD